MIGAFFSWIGGLFSRFVSWIFPAAEEAGAVGVSKTGKILRWIIHIALVVGMVIFLYFVNRWLNLDTYLPRLPFLRNSWLPILFLLLYLLAWLSVLLWKLLRVEEISAFPDILAAWNQGRQALQAAGYDLTEWPLFLVLGKPEGDEKNLFEASQIPLRIKQAPGAEAPIHFYASDQAIYVTCPGASLLGTQANILAGTLSLTAGLGLPDTGEEEDEAKTLMPGAAGLLVQNIKDIRLKAEREGRPLNEWESRQIRNLARRDNPRNALVNYPDQVAKLSARLKYFCSLIVRDRRPFCPINGILVLVPFAATDHNQDATETGSLIKQDLATARGQLGLLCPSFVAVCDFETLPGFREFIKHFSPSERRQRVGTRCPLVPDLVNYAAARNNPGILPVDAMLRSMAAWICNSVVPKWVQSKFQLETRPGLDAMAGAVRHNTQLFRMASEFRDRQERLAKVLSLGLASEATDPPLIGGCYLVGTGRDREHEQAFVFGVLDRLRAEQNVVYWTAATLAEERRQLGLATIIWSVVGGIGLFLLALIVYFLISGN